MNTEEINEILRSHHPTTGMKVGSGQTCECGYWTGTEKPGVNRPVGVRGDQLDWHRALMISEYLVGDADIAWETRGYIIPSENRIRKAAAKLREEATRE